MSEKAIITSDIHIHTYKQFNEGSRRLKNGIDYLDYIFILAHLNGIKVILLPGDLFNNMQIISTAVVNAVIACLNKNFKEFPEIKVFAISGNHDMATKSLLGAPAESALEHLSEIFPNFGLLDLSPSAYYRDICIYGIPYMEHAEHFRAILETINKGVDPTRINILLMHQVVASGLPIEDDIEATDPLFDKFSMVFNGHIHDNQQITDKFINVGAPMHRDAGDIGKQRGFWIVDLDDPVNTISFKDITDRYPQFIHKNVGEELTEEEKKQYVICVPNTVTDDVTEQQLTEKYATNLSPQVLLKNYCEEVLPEQEVKDKLEYGLKLLV